MAHRQTSPKKIGVLHSGGLDSTALIGYYLEKGYEVWPVYVQCELDWENIEIYWARKFLKSVKTKKLKPLKILHLSLEDAYVDNWSTKGKIPGLKSKDAAVFLPGRNLLLITKSLLYLSSHHIYEMALATLKGNPFPDATDSFFKKLNNILSLSFKKNVHIKAPFRKWSKIHVLKKLADFPLHYSFSCINPKRIHHCGRCNKCHERMKAFKRAGLLDRTKYAHTSRTSLS